MEGAADTAVLEEALQANLTIQGMLTAYLSEINETLVQNLPSFSPSLLPAFTLSQQHTTTHEYNTRPARAQLPP